MAGQKAGPLAYKAAEATDQARQEGRSTNPPISPLIFVAPAARNHMPRRLAGRAARVRLIVFLQKAPTRTVPLPVSNRATWRTAGRDREPHMRPAVGATDLGPGHVLEQGEDKWE